MKRLLILVFLLLSTAVIGAEFWLEARKFRVQPGEEAVIDFREGESFTGDAWDVRRIGVARCQWYSTGIPRDLLKMVQPSKGKNLTLKINLPGTQVISMESKPASQKWSAVDFTNYCKEQELDGFVADGDSLTVVMTRFSKVIVQCGANTDDAFKKKTDLKFEIVPLQHPYLLKPGDHLTCQVLFNGKPVPHVLVKVWSRLNRTTFLQNIYSESDGTITFPISTRGAWMVSSERLLSPDKLTSGWKTWSTTLIFGVE